MLARLTQQLLSLKAAALKGWDQGQDWVWQPNESLVPPWQQLQTVARLALILGYGIRDNRLVVRASALTTMSLLSVVPFIAVGIALLQTFGVWNPETLRDQLMRGLPEFKAVIERVFPLLEQTDFAALGRLGLLVLAASVLSMFGRIERSFNALWGIRRDRPLWRKLIDYTGVMLMVTLLLVSSWFFQILSLDLTAELTGWLSPGALTRVISTVASVAFISLSFAILIKTMPNTDVPLKASLIAGAVGGLGYSLVSFGYFELQLGMAKTNLLYSSLAFLPATIVWVEISWILILAAAELAYVLTNFHRFRRELLSGVVSPEFQEHTALKAAAELARNHRRNTDQGLDIGELSDRLRLPSHFVARVCDRLRAVGIVEPLAKGRLRLVAARSKDLRPNDVLMAVRRLGPAPHGTEDDAAGRFIAGYAETVESLLAGLPENGRLLDMVDPGDAETAQGQKPRQPSGDTL